jgi:hypothetical protein
MVPPAHFLPLTGCPERDVGFALVQLDAPSIAGGKAECAVARQRLVIPSTVLLI